LYSCLYTLSLKDRGTKPREKRVSLTLEERVEQIKVRIAGFKLRYSYLYPPDKPVEKPQPEPLTVSNTNKLDSVRAKLLSKN